MADQSESERIRLERPALDPGARQGGRFPAFVGKVIAQTEPITPLHFFDCNPCALNGVEIAGAAVTVTPDTGLVRQVVNLGPRNIAVGDLVIAHHVQNRWVTTSGDKTRPKPGPGGSICVTVPTCLVYPPSGTALIEVKQGATLIGSCTRNIRTYSAPTCCVNIDAGGVFDITVTPSSDTGLSTATKTITATGGAVNNVTVRLYPATMQACTSVEGCPGVYPDGHGVAGATVEFFDAGSTSLGTCVTDATGACCITVANDPSTGPPPFPWSVTATPPGGLGYLPTDLDRILTEITPEYSHGCGVTFALHVMQPDSDHVCCSCPGHHDPVPRSIDFVDLCGATGTLVYGDYRIGPSFTTYKGWAGCLGYDEPAGASGNPYGSCVGPNPIAALIWVMLFCEPIPIKDALDVTHMVKGIKVFPKCRDTTTNAPFGPFPTYIALPPFEQDCTFRYRDPGYWGAVYFDDDPAFCARPINIVGTWTDYVAGSSLVVDTETTFSFIG